MAIHPGPSVRAWLAGTAPPADVIQYFHLIGEQQKAIDRECGQ